MGKLLEVWLRKLEEMEKPGMRYDGWALETLEHYREDYEKGGNPGHPIHLILMGAFNHTLKHELPIPEWVITGLDADKRFQKYRPLPQQCESIEWLSSAEVMTRLGVNDLTLANHVSNKELGYYVRSGQWLSKVAQAVREKEIITHKGNRVHLMADGWTWVDDGEITFDKILANLSDLAFSMKDVIEFETKHLINRSSFPTPLLIGEKSPTLPTLAIGGQVTEEENYIFKKAGSSLKGKIRWEIVYKGMKLPELEYKGLMYVQYYMKHPDDKLFNWEIEKNLEPGMPVETKRPNIDFKEDKDGKMKPDGLQVVGVEGLKGFQPIGDRQTLKEYTEEKNKLDSEIEETGKKGEEALKKELIKRRDFIEEQINEIIQKGKYKGFEDQDTKRINGTIRGSMDELLKNLKRFTGPGIQEFVDHLEKSFKPSYSSHARKWYLPSSPIKWDFGDD